MALVSFTYICAFYSKNIWLIFSLKKSKKKAIAKKERRIMDKKFSIRAILCKKLFRHKASNIIFFSYCHFSIKS